MNAIEAIQTAILTLAGRCDGAINRDNVGYNGTDTRFGHSLADQISSGANLTEKQLTLALKMLKKYQNTQLKGIVTLPKQVDVEKCLAERVIQFDTTKSIDLKGETVIVKFSKNADLIKLVKSIGGGRWNPENFYWTFDVSKLEIVIQTLQPKGFSISKDCLIHIETEKESERIAEEELEEKIEWCEDYLQTLTWEWNFRPFKHQWQAVDFVVSQHNNRALIADTMGLGKTLSALMSAVTLQGWIEKLTGEKPSVIVIAPVSLKMNWLKEAAMVNLKIEVFSYNKIPQPFSKRYLVIADEAHYCQNLKAARTKKMLELSENMNCAGFLALTGTPMKNGRPSNLFPILKAIQHPVSLSRTSYEKRYCDAKPTAFTSWDTTGASNLEELNQVISDKVIRRLKKDCLDLPEKIFTDVECEELSEQLAAFHAGVKAIKDEYMEAINDGTKSKQALTLVMLGAYRRLNSIYKTNEAIKIASDLIEQGEQVVIFTDFVESAEIIAEMFGVPALTGATPQEIRDRDTNKIRYPRQEMVDAFQSGDNKVFVGTIKAGGVGITLTKASYLIMVDFPWTHSDYDQCCDRIHRIGQKSTCNIYTLYGNDIDYVMATTVYNKAAIAEKVLNKLHLKKNASMTDIAEAILDID